ncbi:hypothetical protein [Allosalinactinospora lopnorensis]|uniref:hypothetical protein n=1 Tax=Allosalinactinospora lopnorensis TaxID=1352348 RepID=UPI000623FB34|nr:hypothetical protein [Allosalinactinospora lopnorensis]
MATITIGADHFAYTGRLAPVLPITGFIERFLAVEPRADDAECLARVMLACACHAEGHFALLRDREAIHALLTHPDPATARAYHARLASEYGPLLAEYAAEWDTDPGDPDGEDPITYAALPRHAHAAAIV